MPFGARGVRPPITHPVIDGELRNVSNAFRREGRSPHSFTKRAVSGSVGSPMPFGARGVRPILQ